MAFHGEALARRPGRVLIREHPVQFLLHPEGRARQWGEVLHREFPKVCCDCCRDPKNQVVSITGAGETFDVIGQQHGR
jgi:hypothetical protein